MYMHMATILKKRYLFKQEQVPASQTSIVLRNLQPNTLYTVSLVPVYPATEGRRQSENGKTCELIPPRLFLIA